VKFTNSKAARRRDENRTGWKRASALAAANTPVSTDKPAELGGKKYTCTHQIEIKGTEQEIDLDE